MLEEKYETNKWLHVTRGNSRQIMPMILVSNQPFKEEVSAGAEPASCHSVDLVRSVHLVRTWVRHVPFSCQEIHLKTLWHSWRDLIVTLLL